MLAQDVDYYALLGIDPGADAVTIRKAWAAEQRLWGVRQNAPDLAARHTAELRVRVLAEARDVLLDPSRRALYDVQRVPAWPSGPEPAPTTPPTPAPIGGRSAPRFWLLAVGAVVASAAFVVVLLFRGEQAPAANPPQLAASPVIRTVGPTAAPTAPVPAAAPVRMDAPIAPEPTVTPMAVASVDGLPFTMSATAQSAAGGAAVESEPFALAPGRYLASWSIAGQPPCGIVITLAEPGANGRVPAVLVNHVLKRGDGQLAQGQTSIVLHSGSYRLIVAADPCTWSVTFTAAPPG